MKLPARFHLLLLTVCVCYSSCKQERPDNQPRKIEVLFLGHDSKHHDSYSYLPMLAGALGKKGINFTYTENLEDLNPQKLSRFDALMLYANHDSITTSQESALLNFVKEGKGFMPVHCASYCFRNSDEIVALTGAQFISHETGTFTAEVVAPDNSIMAGFTPFETWDETYVHDLHQPDRTVLMERVEGDHREPWTWTKTMGKGRMFYTAYGHDERTWNNPGFHDLMERGILWAVGDRVKDLWSQLSFPKAVYTAKANIPNYEKRDPAPLFQEPFSQEDSEKLLQVPPGFKAELFAQEPDVINPIAMAWDEKGRLWVVETVDYPNEVRSETGDDRIKICEDTDGDGKADKFTVFAEGLNIPTSIVFARGGIIISMAPDFVFLKDTDGDDKADIRENIITGWGTSDTHAGPSNLTYGFDNQIWGTLGYSGFDGTIAGETHKFGQGFYRFAPDASSFEYLTRTSNNTWGLGFSETFDVFGSTANNAHSWHLAIPNRYYEGVEGLEPRGSKKIAGYYAFHPITPNFRQVDVFGGFTAAAGHKLYTARAYPQEYWNRIAFICEPTGNLLAQGILEKQGAGFQTHDGWNLLASADEWTSPVHAEVGPDGAVWVLDWYNFIIQHNPTPRPDRGGYQAENGKGNAHINPLRDRAHGRIYRIVHEDAPDYSPIELSSDDPKGLVQALKSDNLFWRMTAQRLLVERGQQDVLPALYDLIEQKKVDAIGLNGAAVHALWTLHGLGALTGNNKEALAGAIAALEHPAAGVRKAAIQVLPKNFETQEALLTSGILKDADLHTRLAAVLAAAEIPASDAVGKQLFDLSKMKMVYADEWLSQAVYIAANHHRAGFLAALEAEYPNPNQAFSQENAQKWATVGAETDTWKEVELPSRWEEAGEPGLDGRVLFRKEISLPENLAGKAATLHIGPVDESDKTWLNGVFVGAIERNSGQDRVYPIPAGVLVAGNNVIGIEVRDDAWGGGIYGKPEQMYLQVGSKRIPLNGIWKYEIIERFNFAENKSRFTSAKDLHRLFWEYDKVVAPADSEAQASTDDPNLIRLEIKTVKNEMKYTPEKLSVEAGKAVELVFTNTDLLQHNLLLIQPGSLDRVGSAADKLAMEPNGAEKAYVPEISEVLYTTGMVDPNETVRIRFTAPSQPGDYPFVCTFPGHWRMMNGTLTVVAAGEI